MSSGLAHLLLPLIVGISILLMLIRPRGIAEAWWISAGVVFLLVLGLIPLRLAASAVAEGSDVYLFLIGMMLLSELAREQGVFDWLSSAAVRGAKRQLFPPLSAGLRRGHAGHNLYVERRYRGRSDTSDPDRRAQSKSAATSLFVCLRAHR
jgi:hypothetical protein